MTEEVCRPFKIRGQIHIFHIWKQQWLCWRQWCYCSLMHVKSLCIIHYLNQSTSVLLCHFDSWYMELWTSSGGTCQLLLVFMQENSSYPEFLQQLMTNALLLCSLWCWKREEASNTSSQAFGGVEKIPGHLQSYLQLERALWVACTKPQMFANTVMGLCWHVGWMKGLSATSIHSLNMILFSPCLLPPVKLQWEEFIFILNTLAFYYFKKFFLPHKMKLCSWIAQ